MNMCFVILFIKEIQVTHIQSANNCIARWLSTTTTILIWHYNVVFLSPGARWSHSFFHHYDEDSNWAVLSTYIVFANSYSKIIVMLWALYMLFLYRVLYTFKGLTPTCGAVSFPLWKAQIYIEHASVTFSRWRISRLYDIYRRQSSILLFDTCIRLGQTAVGPTLQKGNRSLTLSNM